MAPVRGGDVLSIVVGIGLFAVKGIIKGGGYVIRRLSQELFKNTTDLLEIHRRQDFPLGGIHKFIFSTNLLQDVHKEIGDQYTHFDVLKYVIRNVREGFAHPSIAEVAKNSNRSLPTSYHIGTTVPNNIDDLLQQEGVKLYSMLHT